MFFKAKYTDHDLLEQIKRGNKDALVVLFESNYVQVKKFVLREGGSEEELEAVLRDALARLWMEIRSGSFILHKSLNESVCDKVRVLWDEQELRRYITRNASVEHSRRFWRRMAMAAVMLLVLIVGVFAWWYAEDHPHIRKIMEKDNVAEADSMIVLPPVVAEIKPAKPYVAVHQESIQDSMVIGVSPDSLMIAALDGVSGEENLALVNNMPKPSEELDVSPENENTVDAEANLVVRKDLLLFVRQVKVVEKPVSRAPQSENLAKDVAGKLNPAAHLPEDEDGYAKTFTVEFWKSPVNYKGYKMTRNKLLVFGLQEPEWVKLYNVDEIIILEYGQNFYELNAGNEFVSFSMIVDPEILAHLKK